MNKKVSISVLGIKDEKVFIDSIEKLKTKKIEIKKMHMDIMDGEFVKNKSVLRTFFMIKLVERGYEPEVHIMAVEENLEEEILKALKYQAQKIWLHVELENVEKYINIIKGVNINNVSKPVSIGLAINPNTDVELLNKYKNKIDSVLVMAVNPGMGGQKFMHSTFSKIKKIRQNLDNVNIVVDGGIKKNLIRKIFQCGADEVVIGNYLTKNVKHMKCKLKSIKRILKTKEKK